MSRLPSCALARACERADGRELLRAPDGVSVAAIVVLIRGVARTFAVEARARGSRESRAAGRVAG